MGNDSLPRVGITARIFGLKNSMIIPFMLFFSNFPIKHKDGELFLSPAASLLLRLLAPVPPLQTLLQICFATETFQVGADL